jgi:hypothetical protein
MMGLTQSLADTLSAIVRLSADGVSPSYQELADELGCVSRGHIAERLRQLKQRGHVEWLPGAARSVRVVEQTAEDLLPAIRRLSDVERRRLIALAAGVQAAADGDGGGLVADALRRIADRLTGAPRARRPLPIETDARA